MKRMLVIFLCTAIGLSLMACGSNNGNTAMTASEGSNLEKDSSSRNEENKTTGKTLVVYFSMPETKNPNNMSVEEANSTVVIDGKVLGNTEYVANVIQENTGAEVFRIESKVPYPTDHAVLVEQAAKEQEDHARPEIKDTIAHLEQYDIIYVGYPNWWGDMPMILYSFFEQYDLSGKIVIPFNTHGGSGFSNTINEIVKLEPGAALDMNGFTVSRNNVQDAKEDIVRWLQKNK